MEGFESVRSEQVDEIGGEVELLRHQETGARIMSVQNDDNNKVFCISFPTLSDNSTGVAHILEHCALCGSPSYPVKDPFFELVKGSMNTFINAMTSRDRTYYPLASTNQIDFCNQMRVYLDLVLRPLLRKETFEQEGWHYFLDEEEKLQFGGVVFNEMKGAYSDPQDLLSETTMQALFPDSPYRFDSGGNPEEIPMLTYDDFKAFHEQNYHPSQSFVIVYGNFDKEAVFGELREAFSSYSRNEKQIDIPSQARFTAPREVEGTYAASDAGESCYVTINWLLGPRDNVLEHYERLLLDHILLMRPSSPLRKALIESGLGDGIAEWGYSDYLKESCFGTGLRGVKREDCKKVESLILDTLETLAKTGIAQEEIEASLNQFEFSVRENNTGGTPQGLKLVGEVLKSWTYGEDPIPGLKFEAALEHLKKQASGGDDFLIDRLKQDFLENTHRVTTILSPSTEVAAERDAKERAYLDRKAGEFSAAQLEEIKGHKEQLEIFQNTPNTPEELATIPRLKKSEVSPEPEHIESSSPADNPSHVNVPIRANGLVYLAYGFNVSGLGEEDRKYLPLLCSLLRETGTSKEDYAQFDRRISSSLGGIHAECFPLEKYQTEEISLWFFLRGKALVQKSAELFSIGNEILTDSNLANRERALQLIRQARSGIEQNIVPMGHSFAHKRASARFSVTDRIGEEMSGFKQLEFLRELEESFDSQWEPTAEKLVDLRNRILKSSIRASSLTADEQNLDTLYSEMKSFASTLPDASESSPALVQEQVLDGQDEYFSIPSQIHFCAQAFRLKDTGVTEGALKVISKHVSLGILHGLVREKGGAYGAFGRASDTGIISYASYRDPNMLSTYDAFAQVGQALADETLSDSDIDKYIIGTMSDLSPHLLPAQRGRVALMRKLTELDDDRRKAIREEVLAATAADFKSFGEQIKGYSEAKSNVCFGMPESKDEFSERFSGAKAISAL